MFVLMVDENIRHLAQLLISSVRKLHQEKILVYDLGMKGMLHGRDVGIVPWERTQSHPAHEKPLVTLHAMQNYGRHVFLDADTMVLKDISYLFKGDFRMAITLKLPSHQKEYNTPYRCVNSGVVGVNSVELCQKWVRIMEGLSDECKDQTALDLLNQQEHLTELECAVWNWYHPRKVLSKAKVVHFKGGMKNNNRLLSKYRKICNV